MREDTPGHSVVFFEDDDQLSAAVGAFLTAGDATTIVIETPEHARLLGGDIALDAAETLRRFSPNGEIDPQEFRRVIGPVIDRAARSGRPVRAYGEMVGVLWEAGDHHGAVELERLWNDLALERDFALLCGYRRSAVMDADAAEALEGICRAHDTVEAWRDFAPVGAAPRLARRFLDESLSAWGHPHRTADARLVVSELATNAVIHARSEFSVRLRTADSRLRLAVRDRSPEQPAIPPAPHAAGGRGLAMIDDLASRWGVETRQDGKTVWVELPL
jgi:anti-sigma regulatory factor (Ser/Thr protein kinase)